jgi:hypothetical protein
MAMKSLEHAMKTTGLDFLDFRFFEGIKAKVIAPVINVIVAFGNFFYGGPNSENPGGLIGDITNGIGDTIKEAVTGNVSGSSEYKGNTGGAKAPKIGGGRDMGNLMSQIPSSNSGSRQMAGKNNIKSIPKNSGLKKSLEEKRHREHMERLLKTTGTQHPANMGAPGK